MVGVGSDFLRSPSQVHLEQVAQDCIQVGFEYLQGRRLHSLSGKPVPVLILQVKKFFLILLGNRPESLLALFYFTYGHLGDYSDEITKSTEIKGGKCIPCHHLE